MPEMTHEDARALTDRIRAGFDEIHQLKCQRERLRLPKQRPADCRSVYFVRAANGLVKIGVSADPRGRLKSLQTASPVRLELALVLPGQGADGEAALHARFAAYRSHGEWFHNAPALVEFMEASA